MITILTVGETRDKNINSQMEEYLKRLSNERINVQSVKEEKATNDIEAVKKREAERILEKVEKNKNNSFIIALAEEGKIMNSISFAEFLRKNQEKKYHVHHWWRVWVT